MLFFSPTFYLFFAIVFSLYWSLRSRNWRKLVLLAASYVFYAAWDVRFLSLILYSTILDYFIGRALGRIDNERTRKLLLLGSLVGNLGMLFFFKYFNFFTSSFVELLTTLNIPVDPIHLNIILPVGISFYTFQTLSYTVDVYRKKIPHVDSFLDIAVFVAFFPQLVAGPIVRAADFLPQLRVDKRLSEVPWKATIMLFLMGLLKKVAIADNIGPYVDQVFDSPELYSASAVVLSVVLFGIQIYCDFSGYSDMAIACSRLLGFWLPINFAWPYFATNISDFWRRWHISLSGWLRDYLYIPLGGNRHGKIMQYRNLMLTMVLGGLWHGASWNFVIWGFLHGLALLVFHGLNGAVFKHMKLTGAASVLAGIAGGLLTFWWVSLTWIFFRAEDLTESLAIAQTFVSFSSSGSFDFAPKLYLLVLVFAVIHFISYRVNIVYRAEKLHPVLYGLLAGAMIAVYLIMIPTQETPFIYFQF